MPEKLPVIFFGHGNPMHAISDNGYTQAWRDMAEQVVKPKAILSVSAHWFVPETAVTLASAPRTIHDFGGFPQPLFEVQYPAPGEPELARRVRNLLKPLEVKLDEAWGLDHGTWSVLRHAYPDADVPVVQLSIDESRPASFHYDAGRRLASLRDEGVLIIGSGNIVHNLHSYAWGRHPREPYDWAIRFEDQIRRFIQDGDHEQVVDYEKLGTDAMLSAPTPEHFLPLLYVLGAADPTEPVIFPVEGIDGGSVSMLSVRLG